MRDDEGSSPALFKSWPLGSGATPEEEGKDEENIVSMTDGAVGPVVAAAATNAFSTTGGGGVIPGDGRAVGSGGGDAVGVGRTVAGGGGGGVGVDVAHDGPAAAPTTAGGVLDGCAENDAEMPLLASASLASLEAVGRGATSLGVEADADDGGVTAAVEAERASTVRSRPSVEGSCAVTAGVQGEPVSSGCALSDVGVMSKASESGAAGEEAGSVEADGDGNAAPAVGKSETLPRAVAFDSEIGATVDEETGSIGDDAANIAVFTSGPLFGPAASDEEAAVKDEAFVDTVDDETSRVLRQASSGGDHHVVAEKVSDARSKVDDAEEHERGFVESGDYLPLPKVPLPPPRKGSSGNGGAIKAAVGILAAVAYYALWTAITLALG